MRPPLRIAVLECDTPKPATRAKYGGYGGVFKALLQAGAESLNEPQLVSGQHGLDISIFDVVGAMVYPEDDQIDAVLLTGSQFNAFDDDPWIVKLVEYTRRLLETQRRIRVIGVCFGHQIVGRALGASVGPNELAWEAAVTSVQLTEKGKQLFGLDILAIHQMHRDIVFEHPPSVTPLGQTDVCKVQGMYERGRLFCVQGHPEFNEPIVAEIVESRHDVGVFDDALYKDAMSRVAKHHDGVAVAAAFLRFLLDD